MTIDFQELYRKYLEIYWDGDINNALKLDCDAREAHQRAIENDTDSPEYMPFWQFATKQSIRLSGRVDSIYHHEEDDSRAVYLERVFIVDEGTNVLRLEFGGRI